MLHLKEGEPVCILERPATAADLKSGLYFPHYRNLSGTVFKIYGTGETQQAAIDINIDSLPEEIARRHQETRDQMFNSQSPDARKQSAPGMPAEFHLRYIVLISVNDLQRRKKTAAPTPR